MAEQRLRDSEVERIKRELTAQGFHPTDEARFADCFIRYTKGLGPRERLTFLMRYGPGEQDTRIMFELHVAAEDYYGTRQCDVDTSSAVYEALDLIEQEADVLALMRNFFEDWRLAMEAADRRDSAPAPSATLEGDGRREAGASPNPADVVFDLFRDDPRVDQARLLEWVEAAREYYNQPAPCPVCRERTLRMETVSSVMYCEGTPTGACTYFLTLPI